MSIAHSRRRPVNAGSARFGPRHPGRVALPAAAALFCLVPRPSRGTGELIVNEYNAVSHDSVLKNNGLDRCFGHVVGNGNNWIELVVTRDHLDVRGWSIRWAEVDETPVNPPRDIWYGNGAIKQGVIHFTTNGFWSDLRAGTILTLAEDVQVWHQNGALVLNGTDTRFDPAGGDWWIHVSSLDEAGKAAPLVTTAANSPGDGPGNFSVGHQAWQMRIVDGTGTNRIFGPIGEAFTNLVTNPRGVGVWGGRNISIEEVGRLVADPSADVGNGDYVDDASSTFGAPNTWAGGGQDLRRLRAWYYFVNADAGLVLNEFNAVDDGAWLGGATATNRDARLGRVPGNGGDWLELAVTRDHLDVRGWRLMWAEVGGTNANGRDLWFGNGAVPQGIMTFNTNAGVWADLRAGTLITLAEPTSIRDETGRTVVSGSDTNINPRADDFWIHISTLQEIQAAQRIVAVNNTGEGQQAAGWGWGAFSVSSRQWEFRIVDGAGRVVFGPIGENVGWGGGAVRSDEAGRLEEDPDATVDFGDYDDAAWSSFGMPNTWGTDGRVQDFDPLRSWRPRPPDLHRVGDRVIELGRTLELSIHADTTDGDPMLLWVSDMPAGAEFSAAGGDGQFRWRPASTGVYSVGFCAQDVDGIDFKVIDVFVVGPPKYGQVFLNELCVDPPGNDDFREFVEIRGPAGHSMRGLWLLEIEGDSGGCGLVDCARDLGALVLGSNGLLLLGEDYPARMPYRVPAGTAVGPLNRYTNMENGTVTFLLVSNFAGAVGMDLDVGDDGRLDLRPWAAVVDGVGWSDGGNGDRVYTDGRLTLPGDTPEIAARLPHQAQASYHGAWYCGSAVSNASSPAGLSYSTNRVSSGVPAGACVTPGEPNYPDMDGDGMSDSWERSVFGGTAPSAGMDSDRDGVPNLAEYIAGTDPTDAGSRLTARAAATGGDWVVTFRAEAGRLYTLMRTTNLVADEWCAVGYPVQGSGGPAGLADPKRAGAAFYRLRVCWP